MASRPNLANLTVTEALAGVGRALDRASPGLAPQYLPACKVALFQHCFALVAVQLLETVRFDLLVLAAAAVHWLGIVLVIVRRPQQPTRWDIRALRYGFLPLLAAAFALAPAVWYVVGDISLFERWSGKPLVTDEEVLVPLYVVAGAWLIIFPVWEIIRDMRETRRQKRKAPASTQSTDHAAQKTKKDLRLT